MSGYSKARGELIWYTLAKARAGTNARELFNFLLFPPTERPTAGLRRFIPGEALPFMLDWDQATAQEALRELQEAKLVEYDPGPCLVFVPLALEMQDYKSPTQISGAALSVMNFSDSPVLARPLAALAAAAREAALAARERAQELRDNSKRATAERAAEQMEELAQELDAHRERVSRRVAAPPGPPSREYPYPQDRATVPHGQGSDRVAGPDGPGGERGEISPKNETGDKHPRGYAGGSDRVPIGPSRVRGPARGCVCESEPEPEPEFKSPGKTPPKRPPPPARGGPPEKLGQVLDKAKGG